MDEIRKATVSVIVTTRNQKDLIKKTVDSILRQSYHNYEIIIVDDCSEDGTLEYVSGQYGDLENLMYILNDSVLGAGACKNAGALSANGDYITFLNSGDEWLPEKLNKQIELYEKDGCSGDEVVWSRYAVEENGIKRVRPLGEGQKYGGDILSEILTSSLNGLHTMLMKKEIYLALGGINEEIHCLEDYEFLIRAAEKYRFLFVDEVLSIVTEPEEGTKEQRKQELITQCYIMNGQKQTLETCGLKKQKFQQVLEQAVSYGLTTFYLDLLSNVCADRDYISYSKEYLEKKEMEKCCGCTACQQICPKQAITMEENQKGFLYPVIHEELCIHCGLCEEVCSFRRDINAEKKAPIKIRGVKAQERIRKHSQSGGAFTVLAEHILENNGAVYGAALDGNLDCSYIRVDNLEELERLKGSKYVQAAVRNVFCQVKEDLKNQKKVLFSGTACHIHGLLLYLKGVDTDNLITCSLVCHGVPSPRVYRDYRNYLQTAKGSVVKHFDFRDRNAGWHNHIETYSLENGEEYSSLYYVQLFYSNLALRENCYQCQYADINRISDITLGDFWGIERSRYANWDDNKGISLFITNTDKGEALFQEISGQVESVESNSEECMQINLRFPTARPEGVEKFWKEYDKNDFSVILKRNIRGLHGEMNTEVTENWLRHAEAGESIARYFWKRGMRHIAVCGDDMNNALLIKELKAHGIEVECILEVWNETTDIYAECQVRILEGMEQSRLDELDGIVVTDEPLFPEIMTKLCEHGVPVHKVIPLSFVTAWEV